MTPTPDTSGIDAEGCPCGSGRALERCCAPLHSGDRRAATAEQLMRARYSAHVLGDRDFLRRTWEASTRPVAIDLDRSLCWTGLQIISTAGGNLLDDEGTVEFVASFERRGPSGTRRHDHHEHSRFVRRDHEWVYLDGR